MTSRISSEVFEKYLKIDAIDDLPSKYDALGLWATPAYVKDEEKDYWYANVSYGALWHEMHGGEVEIGRLVPSFMRVKAFADYIGVPVLNDWPWEGVNVKGVYKDKNVIKKISKEAVFGMRPVLHLYPFYMLMLKRAIKDKVELGGVKQNAEGVHALNTTATTIIRNNTPFDLEASTFYEILKVPDEQYLEVFVLYTILETMPALFKLGIADAELYRQLVYRNTLPWQMQKMIEGMDEELVAKAVTRAIVTFLEGYSIDDILKIAIDKLWRAALTGIMSSTPFIVNNKISDTALKYFATLGKNVYIQPAARVNASHLTTANIKKLDSTDNFTGAGVSNYITAADGVWCLALPLALMINLVKGLSPGRRMYQTKKDYAKLEYVNAEDLYTYTYATFYPWAAGQVWPGPEWPYSVNMEDPINSMFNDVDEFFLYYADFYLGNIGYVLSALPKRDKILEALWEIYPDELAAAVWRKSREQS